MFDPTSRYATLAVRTLHLRNGREVAYVARRFLPQGSSLQTLGTTRVAPDERLDALAARTLGHSEVWWQIADAADAVDPTTLLVEGDLVRVPVPGRGGGAR